MANCAIVGINWGDEGKGRMVDLLSEEYDVVCRYQGGNNAGHTVINNKGKFILNLLPSGILSETTVNIMGVGMVVDLQHLSEEVARLREGGIRISPENLKISDKATICMPYHKLLDELEEDRLADKKFGSTRRGIAPNRRGTTAKSRFGNDLKTSAPIRLKAQPISPTILTRPPDSLTLPRPCLAAIRLPHLPTALRSAMSRTVQEFTITSSASASFATFSCPAATRRASTASLSRTFIWQPYVCT